MPFVVCGAAGTIVSHPTNYSKGGVGGPLKFYGLLLENHSLFLYLGLLFI